MVPYGAPAPAAPTPDQFAPPPAAPIAANPFAPPETPTPQQMYGQQSAQPPAQQPSEQPAPFASPQPPSTVSASTQNFETPGTIASSIGFASPTGQEAAPAPEPAAEAVPATTNPALRSMDTLSGQAPQLVSDDMKTNGGQSMADQAYGKLMSMDAFDLVKDKDEQSRNNPFDTASTSLNTNASLADMKKQGSVSFDSSVFGTFIVFILTLSFLLFDTVRTKERDNEIQS